MGINIKATVSIAKVMKNLERMNTRSRDIMMSDTLNDLGFDARDGIQKGLPHWIRLTKAFIPKQVVVEKSRRRTLRTRVGFTDKLPLVGMMTKGSNGGIRLPFGKHIAVPVQVKRSKKGGITKAQRPEHLLTKPNIFVARIGKTNGIWRRNSKHARNKSGYVLDLLYVLKDRTSYKGGEIKLFDTVEKVVKRRYKYHAERNIKKQLAYMRNKR